MLPFRRILFPVDYSGPCNAVVPYAQDMLRQFSADITLVHSYGPASAVAFAHSQTGLTNPNLQDDVRTAEQGRLHQFAQQVFPGRHVETIAELGEPGSVIHKVAQQQEADLIMLATHGHGPVRRFLLGSVTAKVLHDASAAVWTGIGSLFTEHAPRIPYRAILCALDDTDEAEAVLKAASALAAAYQAQLSLLHVVVTPVSPRVDFSPYQKELTGAALVRMRELQGKLGVDAPHSVVSTEVDISDCVRQEVIRRKADLVVTGRGHAQGTLSSLWSHLYPIVRESPCPVLSI